MIPVKTYKHYFLALLFFISLLVLFFSVAKDGTRDFFLMGDEAALELRVVNATKNIQFLGPYSRFGWNHPGPIYFYLLLPIYVLFSMGTQSLYVGAIFINILSLLTLLYFIFKSKNNYFFYFMAFFLSLYIYYFLGLPVFRSIWNPHVTILPFGALIFICAYMSLGNIKILPLAVLLASFIVQTHVAYVPAIMVIVLMSLLLYSLDKWRLNKTIKSIFSKEVLKTVSISTGIFLVLWILPIVELFSKPRGNLRELASYFFHSSGGHSAGESISAVSGITNAPLLKFLNIFFPNLNVTSHQALFIFFLLQIILVIAAGIVNFKHGKKYQLYLLVFGLAGLIVSVISVTRITDEIHIYLVKWMSMIGFINWCIICFTFFCLAAKSLKRHKIFSRLSGIFTRYPGHKKILQYTVIVVVSALLFIFQLNAVGSASRIHIDEFKYRFIGNISNAIMNYADKNNLSSFLIKPIPAMWPIEAGVINQLYKKSSISIRLEDEWLFWFGYQFKQTKRETDIIFFKKERKPQDNIPNRVQVHHVGQCSIYHMVR
jgi:hypothetical protein